MRYGWLLLLLDLLQQSPRMVLRTTTNLLDQENRYVFRRIKNFVREIFAVTDNHENFLTAKISRFMVYMSLIARAVSHPDQQTLQ